jgi:hypothetical protein
MLGLSLVCDVVRLATYAIIFQKAEYAPFSVITIMRLHGTEYDTVPAQDVDLSGPPLSWNCLNHNIMLRSLGC